MTEDMMDLQAMVGKSPDADFLRDMIGFAAKRLMELEVGGLTGAAYGEKDAERLAQRNGYRERDWETRAGTVELRVGERTPALVRFSTVAGSKGLPDLARDVRGFAVKLYTQEGNWDLVGNNIPVFFIQDAIKFSDLIHAAKPELDRDFPQAQTAHDNFWDFISLTPESMHMVMWIMSDRAIHRSLRSIEGFGVHTFRLVDGEGRSTFVKFHWKPKQGLQSVVWNEAVKINGADPDFHRRDLWDAINAGDFPGGNWASSCSTTRLLTASTSMCSTPRRSFLRNWCRFASSDDWFSIVSSTISSPKPSRSRS
jgi:hypothetical protein